MSLRRTDHGRAVWADPGADRPLAEFKTMQCCHCGGHWVPKPGSGRVRGWCNRCAGFVCGNQACDACVPAELQLENIEAGRPIDFVPVVVCFATASD